MAGAMGRVLTPADALALRGAASSVSTLLDAGLEMDEVTTAVAFRATADAVERVKVDRWMQRPCPPSLTRASRWASRQGLRPSAP